MNCIKCKQCKYYNNKSFEFRINDKFITPESHYPVREVPPGVTPGVPLIRCDRCTDFVPMSMCNHSSCWVEEEYSDPVRGYLGCSDLIVRPNCQT